jgi:fused signal recognition particle receptor
MGMLERMGLVRLKEGLAKTREGIVGGMRRLVLARRTIDEELLDELEEVLIRADVGVETSLGIIDALKERVKAGGVADSAQIPAILKEELRQRLEIRVSPIGPVEPLPSPQVILVVGINGVGKTTTIGKLAARYGQEGKRVLIAAADTFRAAANEQLEVWATRAGADIVQQRHGADPGAVAYDAVQAAMARGTDLVIIDTAGRLHTKVNLMEELRKIKRVLQKLNPAFPHEVLLVLDASTGQNGLKQAEQFNQAVGVTGLVVTKLDGTARGGIVIAVCQALKIPVRYIGVGEELGDLQPFEPEAFIDALFSDPV